MKRTHCHLCGDKNEVGQEQPWRCMGCGNLAYENGVPTVDLLLFDHEGRALLAERGIEPSKGKFDLPGGFVELEETLEQALVREMQEELGLTPADYSAPVYLRSTIGKYKFSNEVRTTLSTIFVARLLTDKQIKPQDDVASVRFVHVDELDTIDFALPSYPETIRLGYEKLLTLPERSEQSN